MVFGSMQAADVVGKTVYWETFRFEWVDGEDFLQTVTQGKDSGTYQSVDSEEGNQIRLKGYKNFDEKVQNLFQNRGTLVGTHAKCKWCERWDAL